MSNSVQACPGKVWLGYLTIAVSVDWDVFSAFDLWLNMMLNHKPNKRNIGREVKCNMNTDHLDMIEKLLKASLSPNTMITIGLVIMPCFNYSKTCLKQPLKNRQNKDFNWQMIA